MKRFLPISVRLLPALAFALACFFMAREVIPASQFMRKLRQWPRVEVKPLSPALRAELERRLQEPDKVRSGILVPEHRHLIGLGWPLNVASYVRLHSMGEAEKFRHTLFVSPEQDFAVSFGPDCSEEPTDLDALDCAGIYFNDPDGEGICKSLLYIRWEREF